MGGLHTMIWQNKKIFSIIFAALAGIGIVFLAWDSSHKKDSLNNTVSSENERGRFLQIVPQDTTTKANSGKSSRVAPATTTTNFIAQKLIPEYLSTRGLTESVMSEKDAEIFAENLLKESLGSSLKQYAEKDFVVIETSAEATESYKIKMAKTLETLFLKNSFDELLAVAHTLDSHDEAKLAPLADAISRYQTFITSLLSVKVPREHLDSHIYLTQSFATILSGTEDMQKMMSDPIRGLQGIETYKKGLEMFVQFPNMYSGTKK